MSSSHFENFRHTKIHAGRVNVKIELDTRIQAFNQLCDFGQWFFEFFSPEWNKQNKKKVEENNKRAITNKTIMTIIFTSQFFSPLFYCTLRLQCTIIHSTMCRKFALNILDHTYFCFLWQIYFVCVVFFIEVDDQWPLSQKFIACTAWVVWL